MFKKLFYNVLDDNDIKYLKLSKEIVTMAQKNHALNRALECDIPDDIYSQLMELCSE